MVDCALRSIPVPGDALATPEANVYIVVIPGLGDPPVQDWSKVHDKTLVNDLISQAPPPLHVQILVAEHGLTSGNLVSWDRLLVLAKSLLARLETFLQRSNKKPVLFVCHGLGGIVLKQLLVRAQQSDTRGNLLFSALAGVVLLGTPHFKLANQPKWQDALGILATGEQLPPEALTNMNALKLLEQVSSDFEDLAPSACILSAFESKESKVKRSRGILGSKKFIIVDSSLASIGLPNEEVVSVESDHNGLCELEHDRRFRRKLIQFTHDNLLKVHNKLNPPSHSVLSDRSTVPTINLDNTDVVHEASQGTDRSNSRPTQTRVDSAPKHSPSRNNSQQPVHAMPGVPRRWRYVDRRRELNFPCYLLDNSIAVSDFFGREDVLKQIDKELLVPDGLDVMPDLKTLAICGIGGIGKTSIASHFVESRKGQYDAIFWLNADTAPKLADSFGKMALKLNLQAPGEDKDKVMSRTLVLEWLANPVKSYDDTNQEYQSKAKWLLVFDNVDDFGLMKGFWPPEGAGSVLLTSRDPLADSVARYSKTDHGKLTRTIQLEPFSEAEAATFLRKIIRRQSLAKSDKAASDVARRLQGLPLALRQIAGIMTRRGLKFNDLLKIYNEESALGKLHDSWEDVLKDNYGHNLATVWGLEGLDNGARMLMNVLAFFDPDHIQEVILREGAAQVKATDYPKSEYEYSNARTGLWKSSLVNVEKDMSDEVDDVDGNEDDENDTETVVQDRIDAEGLDTDLEPAAELTEELVSEVSVHRVVQDAARAKMSNELRHEAFEAAVTLLLARWRRKERLWHYDREDWPRADHLYPHVTQLHSHYEKLNEEARVLLASRDLVKLFNCAGWFDHERGRSEESKVLFTTTFKISEEYLKYDEELMLEIHTSLGCIATEINDAGTCFKHYTKLLEMTKEKYANPKEDAEFDALMVANNEMGIAHMMMEHIGEASPLFERAQKMATTQLHSSETAVSIYFLSSANLGLALWLDGQYPIALKTLTEAWKYHESLAEKGQDTGFAPGRLAHAIGNVRESEEKETTEEREEREDREGEQDNTTDGVPAGTALDWYKRSYKHYEDTIGLYHHRTADVCHKLAGQYIKRKEFDNAHLYINHALEVFKSRSHYRPELARTLNLHSILVRAEGDRTEAKKIFETAKEHYARHTKQLKNDKFKSKIPKEADFDKIVTFWSR